MSHDAHEIRLLPPAVQVATRLQGCAVPDDGGKSAQATIVRQLCSGDRPATERFVREHTGWMLALAKRYVKDQALAEDCVQEAFLQAFRSIREFEGRSALKSWLFRIVVNTALMRLQVAAWLGRAVPGRRAGRKSSMRRMPGTAWTEVATPQEILQRKEVRELVVAKLMELPDGYRIVLLLRDIEGYEHRGSGKGPGHDRGCREGQAA